MFIEIQDTPNPSTLKFILNDYILPSGAAYQFASKEDAKKSILASRLFDIKNISTVFIGSDFVSVTIDNNNTWDEIKPKVLSYIQEIVMTGVPVVEETAEENMIGNLKLEDRSEEEKQIINKIIELFDERIRPAVAMDGGDIVFKDYQDGLVYLSMHGACAGCPSSTITLKNGIENMLKYYIPEVKEVVNLD